MPNKKNETIETVDLTEQDQIDAAPVIIALPEDETEPEENEITEQPVEIEAENVEAEAPAAADPEPEKEDPAPEAPEQPANDSGEINGKLDDLFTRTDTLIDRIAELEKLIGKIVDLEEKRAAGPSGFFAPVDDGSRPTPEASLPYIERKYI